MPMPSLYRFASVAAVAFTFLNAQTPETPPAPLAHFHHVHLNSTDPKAAIDFYTSTFDCEKGKFAGALDAVWAQKSWLLFTKVNQPPKSEIDRKSTRLNSSHQIIS